MSMSISVSRSMSVFMFMLICVCATGGLTILCYMLLCSIPHPPSPAPCHLALLVNLKSPSLFFTLLSSLLSFVRGPLYSSAVPTVLILTILEALIISYSKCTAIFRSFSLIDTYSYIVIGQHSSHLVPQLYLHLQD
jgi:hypothetical protein